MRAAAFGLLCAGRGRCTGQIAISACISFAHVSNIDYIYDVKSSEFKRWLAKQGATFSPAKGSHFHVFLNGKKTIIPMHQKEIPTGTVEAIKKQLGLK